MNILALETTSNFCSVALLQGENFFTKQALIPQQHAQVLLGWIEDLLREAGMNLSSLDAICYSCGPGGFTGIRISAAIVQGIAMVNNTTVLAIPSLQVIAQGIFHEMGHQKIIVLQDARMQQIYYGWYELDANGMLIARQNDQLVGIEELNLNNDVTDHWLVTDALSIPKINEISHSLFLDRVITDFYPKAADVIYLASKLFKKGIHTTAQEALPVYLRAEDAWKKLG